MTATLKRPNKRLAKPIEQWTTADAQDILDFLADQPGQTVLFQDLSLELHERPMLALINAAFKLIDLGYVEPITIKGAAALKLRKKGTDR